MKKLTQNQETTLMVLNAGWVVFLGGERAEWVIKTQPLISMKGPRRPFSGLEELTDDSVALLTKKPKRSAKAQIYRRRPYLPNTAGRTCCDSSVICWWRIRADVKSPCAASAFSSSRITKSRGFALEVTNV